MLASLPVSSAKVGYVCHLPVCSVFIVVGSVSHMVRFGTEHISHMVRFGTEHISHMVRFGTEHILTVFTILIL